MPAITFMPSDRTVECPAGSPLLDAAKAAGVHAETPCGGRGLCRKCVIRVLSGKIEYRNNGALPADLAAQGYALLCRSRAAEEPSRIELTADAGEKGKFSRTAEDLLLIDPGLMPARPFDPVVRTMRLTVPPPSAGDGLSDHDRLLRSFEGPDGEKRLPLPVLRKLPRVLRERDGNVTLHWAPDGGGMRIADIGAGDAGPEFGVAADIGTTTVAALLVSMDDGAVLAARTEYNAQTACGLDVISRINYAGKPERLEELRAKVLSTVNGIVEKLAASCGIEPSGIRHASVAGNTAMTHLLLGIDPEYIRLHPYTPAVYRPPLYAAGEIGLSIHPGTPVHIAPCVGSYLGGDITSGLLCTPLARETGEIHLFIDIGTNGEMVLGSHDFLVGCACSAGPAFEGGGIEKGMRASDGAIERVTIGEDGAPESVSVIGDAQPIGICGSGMISLIADLFGGGWLDQAGKLRRDSKNGSIRVEGRSARYVICAARGGGEIYITEADIDNLIRAKAAIFSACRAMLGKVGLGFEDLSKVYIAGGFGRYLDMENARTIGLLPDLPDDRFAFLGNTSLSGAYMTLLSGGRRGKQREIADKITYLDLSLEPEYMREYVAALFLPHTDEKLFARRGG